MSAGDLHPSSPNCRLLSLGSGLFSSAAGIPGRVVVQCFKRSKREGPPVHAKGNEPKAHGIEQLAVNTIRTLAIDAIERANSGHPGMPMGAAPMAFVLWTRFCVTTRMIPGGPTGTGLCFRPDTDRCYYTACCIFRAMISR